MSPLITLPNPDFVPDTIADADQIDANFSALASVLNGGIDDDNISAQAEINGNKLSQQAGEQVPEAAHGTKSVSDRVLANDAASDAARAVGTNHIKDLAVTSGKLAVGAALANLAAATVGLSKLNIAMQTRPFDISGSPISTGVTTLDVQPSPALPTASTTILGFYLQGITNFSTEDIRGLYVERIVNGANWAFRVHLSSDPTAARVTGNIIIIPIVTT